MLKRHSDGQFYLRFVYLKRIVHLGPFIVRKGTEQVKLCIYSHQEDQVLFESVVELIISSIDDLSLVESFSCVLVPTSAVDATIKLDGSLSWRHDEIPIYD